MTGETDQIDPTCLQCGTSRSQVRAESLFCATLSGYETVEVDQEWERHRWADWSDRKLDRAGIAPAAYLENGASDGIDQGYTLASNRRFITVHDKARTLSALSAIEDTKADQARSGDRGALSMSNAAGARKRMLNDMPDTVPATAEGTVADGAQVSADQMRVGDTIEGVLGSTGDRGNLRVESATADGAMDLITGRNDTGERDTVRIPSGHTATRIGTAPAGDTLAWGHTPETTAVADDEVGMLSTSDLGHGDVIVGKAGGRTGRWELVRPLPNNNPLFDRWEVVPEGRPDATPSQINLSKKRPVKVVARGDGRPEPTDENGFAEGELRNGDVPASGADLDDLFDRAPAEVPAAAPAAAEDGAEDGADSADEDADVRPEVLSNGHLPNPLGMTLPADLNGDYEKHRRTPFNSLPWVTCEDTKRGHIPGDAAAVGEMWIKHVGQCISCGQQVVTPLGTAGGGPS